MMPDAVPDYSDYQDELGEGDLAELTRLAEAQAEAEREVASLTAQLAQANDRLREISEGDLPTLMDKLGMEEFKTRSGLQIGVVEKIRASIPKARATEAFNWLDEHGHASIVKRNFVISFGRDEEKLARKFVTDLKRRKRPLTVTDGKKVEPSTLRAFVTNALREGQDIPLELFGVFRQRISKIGS